MSIALIPGVEAARPSMPTSGRRIVIDRLTYFDGAFRSGRSARFVWLGFDASRTSEAVPEDVPEIRSAHAIVPVAGEHFESITVDLKRRGDLKVMMLGRHTGTSDPRPVPGSANRNGVVKGSRVVWRTRNARPGTYTFTARFTPFAFNPQVNTFMPEARVALDSGTLIFSQHVAAAYGPPKMQMGSIYGPTRRVKGSTVWTATPSYVAQGAYSWAAGTIGATRSRSFDELTGGAGDAFNTGSMGTGTTNHITGAKVDPYFDFTYDGRFGLTGFRYGLMTAQPMGEFFPFDTGPGRGLIYDGDSGSQTITASAASVHARRKREPKGRRGRLVWDWNGAVAEGWGTKDEHASPVSMRADIDPVLGQEIVLYARAARADIDNRNGRRMIKGRRWYLDLPEAEFGFIFHGTASPADSGYQTRSGFARDDFFLQPTIPAGGYLLKGKTRGYFRDWQAAEMVSANFFGLHPRTQRQAARIFTFPPGVDGRITAATTEGLIERFRVRPGKWLVTADETGFNLRALNLF